jgi:adenylate cyclase class 2
MPGTYSNQEVEIKLRVTDVSGLRRRLKKLGAREVSPRAHESNTLYDTPKNDLARRGQLIRIRNQQPISITGGKSRSQPSKCILTYKGPSQTARRIRSVMDKPKNRGRYKVREEVEVAISDGEQMRRILSALGLRPLFRYEKFRTTYALPKGAGSTWSPRGQGAGSTWSPSVDVRNLKIEFDETPIGTFLELEGAPSAINRVAALLGYTRSDFFTQTYGALYIADCRRRGRKPTHMLFPSTKKLR